jgi:hypothetical protein
MLPPDLKHRVLAAAADQPSATRQQLSGRSLILLLSAILAPLAIFAAVGGVRLGPRPISLTVLTAVGALAIAGCALFVAVGRGPSMLGRARGWLIGTAVVAPLAFLAWKITFSAGVPNMMEAWAARPGYRCFALTAVLATWPLFVLAWMRQGSDPTHPRSLGLALGVSSAAAAAALVDLWCPVGHVQHLVTGHVAPMVLLGMAGVVLGQRVLALRLRRPHT